MKFYKKICIDLPQEMNPKIEALAAESCRLRAKYIRQIIRVYLQEIEEDPSRKI